MPCSDVPYISHLQRFRTLQHKHKHNLTVSPQHQGACIMFHQSASTSPVATQVVQRHRQRQSFDPVRQRCGSSHHHLSWGNKLVWDDLKVTKTQCRYGFVFSKLQPLTLTACQSRLNGHWISERRPRDGYHEGGKVEDTETEDHLLCLMCDKCSQLGEFSCSLEQVITQEMLLVRPRSALDCFSEMHTIDVCVFLYQLTPKRLTYLLLNGSWGTNIKHLFPSSHILNKGNEKRKKIRNNFFQIWFTFVYT